MKRSIFFNVMLALILLAVMGSRVWAQVACPSVTGISPATGPIGTSVTITGVNLTGLSAVKFADNRVAGFTTVSPTEIRVTVPSGAVTGRIVISKTGCEDVQTDLFTVPSVCPTVSTIDPASGPVGTSVTITGANLTDITAVKFADNRQAGFTIISSAEIRATVPSSAVTGRITISKTDCEDTQTAIFTVPSVCPTISMIDPAAGPVGTSVTITGTNLTGVSGVKFADNRSAGFTLLSPTQIRATVPSGTITGRITLSKIDCEDAQTAIFTVPSVCPTISMIDPVSGPIGTSVTITGTNFTSVSGVKFADNRSAGFTILSATQIRATVPSGAVTGPIVISKTDCEDAQTATFTIPSVCPTVSGINPTSGPVGTSVTITGTNFTGISGVKFANNRAAGFTILSSTEIRATAPSDAFTGAITISKTDCPDAQTGAFFVTPTAANCWSFDNFDNLNNGALNGQNNWSVVAGNASALVIADPRGAGKVIQLDPGAGQTIAMNKSITSQTTGVHALELMVRIDQPGSPLLASLDVTANGNKKFQLRFGNSMRLKFSPTDSVSFLAPVQSQRWYHVRALFDLGSNRLALFLDGQQVLDNVAIGAGAITGIAVTGLDSPGAVLFDDIFACRTSLTQQPACPTVSGINPVSGPVGASVIITGTNLNGLSAVRFADNRAASFTANAAGTQITATVPGSAVTGVIILSKTDCPDVQTNVFTVPSVCPVVSAITPTSGAVSTSVTITGINLNGLSAVRFANNRASSFSANTAGTQITATVPGGAVTGPIILSKTDCPDMQTAIFTVPSVCPVVSNVTPTSGAVGTSVTITGTNLNGLSAVRFANNRAAGFSVNIAGTQITATIPGGAVTGPIILSKTDCPDVGASNFVVPSVCPTVGRIDPVSGPISTSVTITGTNFSGLSAVKFANNRPASFSVDITNTQITTTVPSSAVTGRITLSKAGCADVTTNIFTIPSVCPTVSRIDPASGAVGANITITGANFTSLASVKFSFNRSASFTVNSATQITVTVPSGAVTGPITLSKTDCPDVPTNIFTVPGTCTNVSGISPLTGATGALVTISGTNLIGVNSVKFSQNVIASIASNNGVQLTTIVPSGAITGPITLTRPGCPDVLTPNFTVNDTCPSINSFSPNSGAFGANVTITGVNFNRVATVKFFDKVNASIVSKTATQIVTTVPFGAGTGPITLSGLGCPDATTATNFAVIDTCPKVSSISPKTGRIGASVTITGTNLLGARVQFANNVAAAITSNNGRLITTKVPSGAVTGPIILSKNSCADVKTDTFTVQGFNLIYNQIDAGNFPTICSFVTVLDDSGKPVVGLNASNFAVMEDGRNESPIMVTPVGSTNDPISVALVIDRSGSMSGQPLDDAKAAAMTFVNQLTANDQGAIIDFDDRVTVTQGFTSNKNLLLAAISSLTARGGTNIYDALVVAVNETNKQSGRKAILLLTDGENGSSSATLQQAIDAAVQAGLSVYSIGLNISPNSRAEQDLQKIATDTNGRYFAAPSSTDLTLIYQLISRQLQNQYKICYLTHNPSCNGTTRTVKITAAFQNKSDSKSRTYMAPANCFTCYTTDNFDNLNTGCLSGQNGWFTVPGRTCALVIPNPAGAGKVLRMEAGPNETVIMGKDVNDQIRGRQSVEIAVWIDKPSQDTLRSLAKLEVRTTGNPKWDKKFQLYFGTHMRLNFGPTLPEAREFLSSRNLVSRRWYRVRAIVDLATNLVDVYLDDAPVLQGVAVGPGPITDIGVSAWDRPGSVLFDDIRLCREDAPAGNDPCNAASFFDADDEGWMAVGDPVANKPNYFSTRGNPGGYISATDAERGATWYWQAPAKFLGDASCAYGQAMTFDLRQADASSQFDEADVILEGAGLTLVYDTPYNPGTSWTSYSVSLVETAGWKKNTLAGPAPTQAEMKAVLAGLTKLQIRGEYRNGTDTGDLDNVVLNGLPKAVGPLQYAAHNIDDDAQGSSNGDGDGRVESGERIEMTAVLQNSGVQTATDVTAKLSSTEVDATIFDSDNTWPDIAAGASQLSTGTFGFAVNANLAAEKIVTFTLTVTARNGGPWISSFDVPIAPENKPPVVANPIADQTLKDDSTFTRHLKMNPAVFRDPDQDLSALKYSANSSDTLTVKARIISDTTLTVAAQKPGLATIIVTANDGRGGAARDTFQVTVISQSDRDKVYVMSSGNNNADQAVLNALAARGVVATLGAQAFEWDGTQARLSDFKVVVLLNSYNWSRNSMPEAGQTALLNYVAGGGGLVTGEWLAWNAVLSTRHNNLRPMLPVIVTDFSRTGTLTTYTQVTPDSIINQGLPVAFDFPLNNISNGTESLFNAKSGATVFYSSRNSGASGLVGWNYFSGRVISFSTFISDVEMVDPDYAKLFVNTVAWAGGRELSRERSVRVARTSASPGSAVSVPLELVAQGDENALGFSLNFDPAILANPQGKLGRDASAATLNITPGQISQGRLGIALALPAGQKFKAGVLEIVVVTFTVNPNTSADSTVIGFGDQPINREVVDVNANPLATVYQAGAVKINRNFEADVTPRPNGDLRVTIADWVQVGRFVAGLDTPRTDVNEFQRADCAPKTCGDGRLSIIDWVQAGRYAVSLDPVVIACGPMKSSVPAANALSANTISKTDGARTVRVPDIKLVAGQTKLLLPVELDAQGDENALGFSLNFDPVLLQFDTVAVGNGASGATLLPSLAQRNSGRIGIALALPAGTKFAAGVRQIVVVTFRIAPNLSTSKTTVTFGDQPVAREVVDVNANSLSAIWLSGMVTSVQDRESTLELPKVFELGQNYPNPFNPSTTIKFALPRGSHVTLKIYNLIGAEVATLVDKNLAPGRYQAVWDAKGMQSGVYFYRLRAGEFSQTRRLVLMK